MNSKIALIYIDAGGGHRAAATALCEVIRQQQRPWEVEMLSIQDLLDSIDFIRKSTGIPFQDVYNIMLRRGWTLGTAQTDPADARAHPPVPRRPGAGAGAALGAIPAGPGGVADPALQPRAQDGAGPRVAGHARSSPC